MRKALAFVMVFIVFCCSVLNAVSGVGSAIEGVYDGILSAMASYMSEPQITLQGVSVVNGAGFVPRLISFLRSDVSTYQGSLAFFSNGLSFNGDYSFTRMPQLLQTDVLQEHLTSRGFGPGDVILDGSVRLIEGGDFDKSALVPDDWSSLHARISLSIMATGRLCEPGVIIEGDVIIDGGIGRTVTINAENLKVNNKMINSDPIVLSFAN